MAVGMGELPLAAAGLGLTLVVLIVFEWLQALVDRLHRKRAYTVRFSGARLSPRVVDKILERFPVTFTLRKVVRDAEIVSCWYDVRGHDRVLAELDEFLVNSQDMSAVECTVQGVGRSDGDGAEAA